MAENEDSYVLMARYITRQATTLGWFEDPIEERFPNIFAATCVAIRQDNGRYVFEPPNINPALASAIARLDDKIVFTMSSEITTSMLKTLTPEQHYLTIPHAGFRIPIVSSFEDVRSELALASCACIVRKESLVLVWSDDVGRIVQTGSDVEKHLLTLIWGKELPSHFGSSQYSRPGSIRSGFGGSSMPATPTIGTLETARGALDEKNEIYMKAVAMEEGNEDEEDVESGVPPRPITNVASIKVGLAMILVIVAQIAGIANLIGEYMWDGGYVRFAIAASIPVLSLFSLFFFIVVVSCVFQLFLPLGPALKNTKYHSAIKPKHSRHRGYELPHITIQMPVYKEGLKGVIVPTIMSVLQAIEYYERQGGTASVFVNDDGMQAIEPELADARKQYYAENNIGYCARLPNKKSLRKKSWSWFRKAAPAVDNDAANDKLPAPQALANKIGFVRQGKFKKASNMNYALEFSNRVEDELRRLTVAYCQRTGCANEDLTVEDDDMLYQEALENMLAKDEGRTWAGGNIRIGELILLIDCDTRVPVDCLLYGALEMHESPEVAILQHASGVMQVVHNTFENGITYFTNIIYTSIKYGVGTGDAAPFVGHNAFLRWKAIQSIGYVDSFDGKTKWWSERHVSEDFDISLRLQMAGMIVRMATYHNGGFKEGVSLTVYDELTRWEKYAYGCNELMFQPLYKWLWKGPVTPLFLRFCWSCMPITSKVGVVAYIFTYYAMAAGMLLSVVNYFLVGLFPDEVDQAYRQSFGIWIALILVFNGISSVGFSMLRHRLKEKTFWMALLESIKWLPFLILFFGGISLHCARALLCHMFSINIEWQSTAKEMGPTGFYIGLDKMYKSFRNTWIIILLLTGGMIYLGVYAPWGWTITAPSVIIPLAVQMGCHFLLPLALGLN